MVRRRSVARSGRPREKGWFHGRERKAIKAEREREGEMVPREERRSWVEKRKTAEERWLDRPADNKGSNRRSWAVRKELSARDRSDQDVVKPNLHRVVSSDDEIDYSIKPEFYDPLLDEKDQRWINKHRKGRSSDAVLSCPACFTTLCFDCQRYSTVFSGSSSPELSSTRLVLVFLVSCFTVVTEVGIPPRASDRQKKGARQTPSHTSTDRLIINVVECHSCSTSLGVLSGREIFEFFFIMPTV
ncbi:hypothetical protein KSP39_PZI014682 [Platanthera zijinensis]|uniref:E2F-associated phosphoprotein n=1 Tax=Platanthera zijinensis TaxID=2320716 RepID=A0AAP0BB48_9ASPA